MELANTLFLLMSDLSQLRNKEDIIHLFTQSMQNLFKPFKFIYLDENIRNDLSFVKVQTSQSSYGFIKITPLVPEDSKSLINNTVRMLAIILENLDIASKLENGSILQKTLAEDAIRISESRLRRAELASKSGNWELHLESQKMEASEGAIKLYGVKNKIDIFENIQKIPLPEYRPLLDKALNDLIKDNIPYDIEFKIKTADTAEIKDIHSVAILDNDRQILFGIIQDITERKQVEERMKENEEKFRNLFENSPVGNSMTGIDGSLHVNKSFCEIVGYSEEELKTMKWMEFTHPDDIGFTTNFALSLINKEISDARFEKRYIHKNGSTVWTDVSIYLQRDKNDVPQFFITSIRDITNQKRAEEALKLSEYRYQLVFDNSGTVNSIFDKNCCLVLQNQLSVKLLGRHFQDTKGKTALEIFGPENGPEITKRMLRIFDTGIAEEFNTEFELPDGSKWFHTKYQPFFDEIKQEMAIQILSQDITEQKRTENLVRTLSKAIEQSPASIIITDALGKIQFVNAKFTSFMQYSMDEVKGKNPRILNAGHTPADVFDAMWKTIGEGKIWQGESQNRKKDGTLFWENVVISPLLNDHGTVSNYILTMEDITEKKKMLDDLISAKERAEESDQLKTAFLHNISHEIRTPMNAIIGFSSFLAKPSLPLDKRKYFTEIVVQSSNQLLCIITDIVNIATIEAGQAKVEEEEINLNSTLHLLYQQFSLKIPNHQISLGFHPALPDEEAIIFTDPTKLTEILSNLIGNAVKFTQQGSVNFGYQIKNNFIEFFVEDTGIGIPSKMHREIFKRFRQVEFKANRQFGGSGLGLSISKAYVELLGGEIWLTSEPHKGSAFYFTIPYQKIISNDCTNHLPPEELRMDLQKTKAILIAEDEDSNFTLLEEWLSELQFNILRAANGVEAVDVCQSNPQIDLVLMDIKMPLMDGYEASSKIKRIRPDLPIIAQTAYSDDRDKAKALASGCCDYISKPITQSQLLGKIKEQLEK